MSFDIKATTFVFPHETLTKIKGKPTHESVKLLRKELYANAYENECTLGGGDNGYLRIIMPNDNYAKLQTDMGIETPVPFTKPNVPSATANDIETKTINQQRLDHKAMEGHLKKQIIDAFDHEREYIEAIDDDSMGFAKFTPKALLAYITNKYDVITYSELNANREDLDATWDSSEPIHRLWSRTQKVQRFAKAGKKEIDDDTIMHALLTVLKKTGVFATHITIWKQQPEHTWTLKAFQAFFDEADKERNEHTSKEAGYANAVKTGTKTNTQSANAATTNDEHDGTYLTFKGKKVYYCWSHGGNTNANHTSMTCNRPNNGHINTATWDNMCGGCSDMLISYQNKQQQYRNHNNNNRNGSRNNGNNRNNNGNNNNSSNNNNQNNGNNNNGNNNSGNNNNGNNNNSNNRGNNNQSANSSSHTNHEN